MAEELLRPEEVQLIVIIPGSHLEEITNPEESTFLGYIPDGLDEHGQSSNYSVPIVDMPEGVIITTKSNAAVMAACYATGYSAGDWATLLDPTKCGFTLSKTL